MYNRKISVAEKILANAAKRNGVKLCSNFKIRPINHKVCLQKSFYPFQIPYDFHYFIISYANFFSRPIILSMKQRRVSVLYRHIISELYFYWLRYFGIYITFCGAHYTLECLVKRMLIIYYLKYSVALLCLRA